MIKKLFIINYMKHVKPTKLTDELIINMASDISEGLPAKYACHLYNVTEQSYQRWMKVGEEDFINERDTIYADFYAYISKAQGVFIRDIGIEIRKGQPGWQGKAWWLERTRRDFMPKQQIEANTDDGKVTVVLGGKVKEASKNLLECKDTDK